MLVGQVNPVLRGIDLGIGGVARPAFAHAADSVAVQLRGEQGVPGLLDLCTVDGHLLWTRAVLKRLQLGAGLVQRGLGLSDVFGASSSLHGLELRVGRVQGRLPGSHFLNPPLPQSRGQSGLRSHEIGTGLCHALCTRAGLHEIELGPGGLQRRPRVAEVGFGHRYRGIQLRRVQRRQLLASRDAGADRHAVLAQHSVHPEVETRLSRRGDRSGGRDRRIDVVALNRDRPLGRA